ncbi:unnamed product [Ostreococcus tauri]|uniref:Unnamed product n=1 Tax=Ostreococcus tauri TaxID=70448 RepID=Q00V46_OSTTA|nr:unnamed product [Ostreococcus tauri]CAL57581.1 unnamed product [Ostreococcus tauri]|eukprot:XP_003083305.1 unnamed product [Ostreococcus tauri]
MHPARGASGVARRSPRPAHGTPAYARWVHERGTRRARACILWTSLALCALSLIPRRVYAPMIDVFGDRGTLSIGDRIERAIAAREAAQARERAAREAALEARGRRRRGWFGRREKGASAADAGGETTRDETGGDAAAEVGSVVKKTLSEREISLLEALETRLTKVKEERNSIIYLMRKIRGEDVDDSKDTTALTDEEIETLANRVKELDSQAGLSSKFFGVG